MIDQLPPKIRKRINVSDSGCWLWTAGLAGKGYAYGWWNGGMSYMHRVTYHLLVDDTLPIRGAGRGGMCIDHVADRCDNRHCINPDHLELVTWSENLSRWHRDHPERLEHARSFRRNNRRQAAA